jgi:WD40 repeat protein
MKLKQRFSLQSNNNKNTNSNNKSKSNKNNIKNNTKNNENILFHKIEKIDRFIPRSISPNLKCELSPTKTKSTIKNVENDYQKLILNDLIKDSSPNESPLNNYVDNIIFENIKNSKRKIIFNEIKPNRKKSISPTPLIKSHNSLIYEKKNNLNLKKIQHKLKLKKNYIKPFNQYYFNYCPNNFYFNVLDMFSISEIAIGLTNGKILLINDLKNEKNFLEANSFFYSNYNNDFNNNHFFQIESLKFLNREKIISYNANRQLIINNLITGANIEILNNYFSPILSMDFDNESNSFFFGTEDGKLMFLDLRESHIRNKNLFSLHNNHINNEICNIKYLPKNQFLVSGGNDDFCNIFDIRKNKIIKKIEHKAAVKGIAVNENETNLLTGGGSNDKKIKLFDLKKLNLISEKVTDSQITNIEFINDRKILISFGYNENMMGLYYLNYDKIIQDSLTPMKLCNYFLDLDNKGNLNYIDIFEEKCFFEPHVKRILYSSKDRFNNFMSTVSNDGVLKIWNIEKYKNENYKNNIENEDGIR